MSDLVTDLMDEQQGLASGRAAWENYWNAISAYVLPSTEEFDRLLSTNSAQAIDSIVHTPVAAKRSEDIYDMTSVWAIERLTAGLLSLKTPETEFWHTLTFDNYFSDEQSDEEDEAAERLRNYLFKVRSNPQSGFWDAHRAAARSMCAYGDGWSFIRETREGGVSQPFKYEYVPLNECYPSMDPNGLPDRMFRVFGWSALQIVTKWGKDKAGKKAVEYANDPDKRHNQMPVMHVVRPRQDEKRRGVGLTHSTFESHYLLPDEKHLIGSSGFFSFPFIRYAWANSGRRPFSEGPVAYALAEIKSLQEMSKNELISVQTTLRPAFATAGKNFNRLNLNPGKTNPGMITADGKPLFAPMTSGVRPDFAQSVLEARRNSVREMMYLNLWQIILQDKNETATEAMIRAQEKGEMLGPVGISFNTGLSQTVDREISILDRQNAFEENSPLELPETAQGRNISPVFTSPLDRLRRMSEVIGMQQLVEFATLLGGRDPQATAKIIARFDVDEMIDIAREILGAPVKAMRSKDEVAAQNSQQDQMQQLMAALEMMRAGGEAAQSAGTGGAAMAQGAEAASASPALQNLMTGLPAGAEAATKSYQQLQGGN